MDGFVIDIDSSDLRLLKAAANYIKAFDSLHNYYQNCYGILLRKKGNSVKKRPKKIIISVAAIYSYVMLSLKYVMQELTPWMIYISTRQSLEFWKMQISYYATLCSNLEPSFFLSKNFIAKNL